MNYIIKKAEYKDFDKCVKTIRKAFAENATTYGFTKENYPSSGAFIETEDLIKASNENVHMYIAWVQDVIAGFIQLRKKDDNEYLIQKFSVLPKYQQIGLGKALVLFCKNKASNLNAKKISLIMVDENTKLKEKYISFGFKFKEHIIDDSHPFLQAVMEMEL